MSATLERGPAVTAAYAGRRRLPVAVPVAIALAALVALHPSWVPPVMASLAGALGG